MGVTFGMDYTPVQKFKENQGVTAAVAWTPTTSTKIVLTDFYVNTGVSPAGTFQIRFGNVGGAIIAAGALTGSTGFGFGFETPVYSGVYDRAIFFETGTGSSTSGWNVTLVGFEQE